MNQGAPSIAASSTQLNNMMRSRQEESKLSSRVGSSTNLNGIAQEQTFNKSNKSGTQSPRNENLKYVGFLTANIYQAA